MPVKKPTKRKAPPKIIDAGWRVTRKYGEPRSVESITALRSMIRKDMAELQELADRTGAREDARALDEIRAEVGALTAGSTFPHVIDRVVDARTGVRYHVTIERL